MSCFRTDENDISKQDDRAQEVNEWLQRLQGWKDSGKSRTAYAKEHGWALWAMYRWRGALVREGRWSQELKASAKSRGRSALAMRFAKIAVTDRCPPVPLTLRLHLANGRRAEIDLTGIEQLQTILGALERQP